MQVDKRLASVVRFLTEHAKAPAYDESKLEASWLAANEPRDSADDTPLENQLESEPYDIIRPEPPAAGALHDRSPSRQESERDPHAGLKRLFSTLRKRQQ